MCSCTGRRCVARGAQRHYHTPFATLSLAGGAASLAGGLRVPFFRGRGGFASCGIDLADTYPRAASYIDLILNGAKPADLPIQLPPPPRRRGQRRGNDERASICSLTALRFTQTNALALCPLSVSSKRLNESYQTRPLRRWQALCETPRAANDGKPRKNGGSTRPVR
jgi:hypothetical protein